MLKARIITALVLFPLLLAAIFLLHGHYWASLMFIIVLLGNAEWSRIASYSKNNSRIYLALTAVLGIFLLYFTEITNQSTNSVGFWLLMISSLFWLLIVPLWLTKGWQIRNPIVMGLIGWIVLIPTWLALVQLQFKSPVLLLALMAVVWIADIAAYFSGKKFGKHKLAPSISPGKTWEGVAGAYLAVAIYAAGWLFYDRTLMTHFLDHETLSAVLIIIVVWIMAYFSILGDLFESWMKRQAGLKDSGNLLPGHGGVLDRIDGLTSTLPLISLLLICLSLSTTS